MYTITGGGAFSRTNINQINSNFSELVSGSSSQAGDPDVWVRPQYGNNNNAGTFDKPFATMSGAARAIEPGIIIGLQGVLKEEYTLPIVNDVTIVGFANQPRQATTSGVANGGGATWMSSSDSATTPLLTVQGQASKVQNVYFSSGAGVTANPCLKILTAGDPPAQADGAHVQILGCYFTGTDDGIQANGGTNFVTIAGCTFLNFVGAGDTAISQTAGAGVGTLLGWQIIGNNFFNNVNHVILPLSRGVVAGNNFNVVGHTVTTTIALSLTGGAGNSVFNNMFNRPLNTSPNATLYVGGTNDVWGANIGADNFFFGVPDNS